jgi:hypothetical protein
MPVGTYFAGYDWTCRNQVSYLNGSVCDLKFFPYSSKYKILTAMSKPIEFSNNIVNVTNIYLNAIYQYFYIYFSKYFQKQILAGTFIQF